MQAHVRPLNGNPLPWLLEGETPAVRYLALRHLLDRPLDDPEVAAAREAAMRTPPIATILEHQQPAGYWVKPGAGYSPKYTGTVWQLIFLDQLGADPTDARVRSACEYVLAHSQTASGGFGASGVKDEEVQPPPSRAIHCLTGNVLRALLGFGYLDDPRVQRAVEWQARIVTGEGVAPADRVGREAGFAVAPGDAETIRYYASGANGPGFRCAANDKLPCAWGAVKVMLAFARIPPSRRSPVVERAIERGVEFLLGVDPATALYSMGYGNTKPNGSWFKLGFPSGYVADVLQVLEALVELGRGSDTRLGPAFAWLLTRQDAEGRWTNSYPYSGKTWIDFDVPGRPSKWVTLRACRVLRAAGYLAVSAATARAPAAPAGPTGRP